MKNFLLLILMATLLLGCERRDAEKTTIQSGSDTEKISATQTAAALKDPIVPTIVELPTHALPVWREFREQRPTLVLFSNDPFLKAVPPEVQEKAKELIINGSLKNLMDGLDVLTANPVLMQDMAASSAIEAGLFSEVIWVIATKGDIRDQSAESIQQHLVQYGAVTADKSLNLSKSVDGFNGAIHDTTIRILPPEALPQITEPVVLHFDLSHFSGIYLDEVRSPLIPMLQDLLITIRDKKWQVLAVTISLNNATGIRPLKSRHLGPVMAGFFTDPERLNTEIPEELQRRQQILYLDTFFQEETILGLYQELLTETPDDPSLHFGLYRLYRQMKKSDLAMKELASAVALDRIYGIDYLQLASQAKEQGQNLMAMDMLQLAANALPENVFINMQQVETYLEVDSPDRASALIDSLMQEPWSTIYYPEVPKLLASWQEKARTPPSATGHR